MRTLSKKFNFRVSLLLILLAFFFYSCSDKEKADDKPKKSSEKKITEFSFKSTDNTALATAKLGDITGVVDESKKTIVFSITPPQGVTTTTLAPALKSLKASFKVSNKATVKVGSTEQKSGKTTNDFSQAVKYTVTAEDGSVVNYTVTIVLASSTTPSKSKQIVRFSFKSADNTALATAKLGDITGVIDESKKTIVFSIILPVGVAKATVVAALKSLKASFEVSDKATVKVGSTDQKSGKTANDFGKAVVYTVTAEDGTTQEYTVTIAIKNLATSGGAISAKGLKRGVRNVGFRYLYYPKDGKIYYASEGHIYRMELDGGNVRRLTSHRIIYGNIEHLLIYNDVIYFNGKKLYTMKTDGTGHSEFVEGDIKMPKVFGGTLYYIKKTATQGFSLYSAPLDKSSASKKLVDDCRGCYLDGSRNYGDYYVKGNNLYYHKGGDGLWKVDIQTNASTKISEGKFDNYTFGKDKIYFRYHSQGYSIGEDDYNFTNPKVFLKTNKELEDKFSLNASDDGFTYINRQKRGTSETIDIFFVSKSAKTQTVLVSSVIGANWASEPKSVRGLKIIGDWIYYLVYNRDTKNYTIHRVKKDGTGKSQVAQFK